MWSSHLSRLVLCMKHFGDAQWENSATWNCLSARIRRANLPLLVIVGNNACRHSREQWTNDSKWIKVFSVDDNDVNDLSQPWNFKNYFQHEWTNVV